MTVDDEDNLSIDLEEPAHDYNRLLARLTVEPFNKSFDELARMTDAQIFDVLLYPRSPTTGELLDSGRHAGDAFDLSDLELTPEEAEAMHYGLGRGFGIPEEELRTAWEAKKRAAAGA